MNSQGHLVCSLVKSIIRIAGALAVLDIKSIEILAGCFLVAEILGVIEELLDKR